MQTHALQQYATATTYEDVADLIHSTVNRFARTNGGDPDDLIGIAHVQFMRCYQQWIDDPDSFKCGFLAALRKWVWLGLIDAYRHDTRDCRCMPELLPDCSTVQDRPDNTFSLSEFAGDNLSDEARTVLGLLFDTASEFAAIVECKAEAKGGQPRNVRSTIREVLRGVGWTAQQIRETFDEIRFVLADDCRNDWRRLPKLADVLMTVPDALECGFVGHRIYS